MKNIMDTAENCQTLKMISPKVAIEYNTMTIPVECHRHEFIEMVFVLNGQLHHHHPYGTTVHERGDVFVINTEEMHWYDYCKTQAVAFFNILISPPTFYEILQQLQSTGGFDTTALFSRFILHTDGFHVLRPDDGEISMMEHTCYEMLYECEHETVGTSIITQSLLTTIMVQLCRRWEHEYGDVSSAYTPRGKMIIHAVNYIQQNFSAKISIDELARQFFVSSDHFRKAFKQIMGVSPLKYINNLRIQYACEIMANPSLSIADVAAQSGFSDLNHFTRVFASVNGVTPSTYRKHRSQMQSPTSSPSKSVVQEN